MLQELDHVVELTEDFGLGILMEDETAQTLLSKGADIRHSKDVKEVKDLKWVLTLRTALMFRPKRGDIISDE